MTMAQTDYAKSLKNVDKFSKAYYIEEIVPYVVQRKLFQPEDVGRLGKSADQIGMGKIRAQTSAGKFVVEYLSKATVHGFNHICAPHRHFIERILAILFIGMALSYAVVLSLYSWNHYQNSASAMVLDYDYKNFEITKPAMTMCLYEPVAHNKFPEVFKSFGVEDTQEARDFFLFISRPSYVTLNQTPKYTETPPEKWLKILKDLYVDVRLQTWDTESGGLSDIQTADIVTERGLCTTAFGTYSNYSSVDYWSSNSWAVIDFQDKFLPAWTHIHRDEEISIHDIPGPGEESIALHFPNDLPNHSTWYSNNRTGIMRIKTTVQRSVPSADMKKLSESQRPCNFPEDGNLKMWPVYTRNFCLMECRFNLMREKCGCHPYFIRPIKGIPICDVKQLHCVGNMAALILSMKINGSNICKCKVDCNTAKYLIISTEWPSEKQDTITEFLNLRELIISAEYPYYMLRYEVFFGFNDFLVSVGGAAGLLLGASMISLIEILYHITLRLFWYSKHISKKRRE